MSTPSGREMEPVGRSGTIITVILAKFARLPGSLTRRDAWALERGIYSAPA